MRFNRLFNRNGNEATADCTQSRDFRLKTSLRIFLFNRKFLAVVRYIAVISVTFRSVFTVAVFVNKFLSVF